MRTSFFKLMKNCRQISAFFALLGLTVILTPTAKAAVNLAPIVNAGPDQTIILPSGANLKGSVTDDGLPTGKLLTKAWSKVSGPGTVTFDHPISGSTGAIFSAAGTYTIRLQATDTLLTTSDTLVVTVNSTTTPPPTTTQVNLTVNNYASGNGPANLVTNAIPFKPGALTNIKNFRILDNGVEIPIFAKVVAYWPGANASITTDDSIRSVLVQFPSVFSTATKNYTLEIGKVRTKTDLAETPINWATMTLPKRIATLPADYLSDSLIVWEQKPIGKSGQPGWEQKLLNNYSKIATPGASSVTCARDDQYYDAISTGYQIYARTGNLQHLVNAHLWAIHHRRDQIWTTGSSVGHPKCESFYLDNTRYTFVQGLAYDTLLWGDQESKRVAGLVTDNFYMPHADSWYYKAPNTRGMWTEREGAFALLGIINYYQITNNIKYLNEFKRKLTLLNRMQRDDMAAYSLNNRSAWIHNLYDHDPSEGCGTGDYGTSSFMTGLMLEGIIEYYKLTKDAVAKDSILLAVNDLRVRNMATANWAGRSLVYLSCPNTYAEYKNGVPDLDNLYSHAFAYAYHITQDTTYKTLAQQLLDNGVNDAYAGTAKHFNQQFRTSGHTIAYFDLNLGL